MFVFRMPCICPALSFGGFRTTEIAPANRSFSIVTFSISMVKVVLARSERRCDQRRRWRETSDSLVGFSAKSGVERTRID